jgi:hypothetical protein
MERILSSVVVTVGGMLVASSARPTLSADRDLSVIFRMRVEVCLADGTEKSSKCFFCCSLDCRRCMHVGNSNPLSVTRCPYILQSVFHNEYGGETIMQDDHLLQKYNQNTCATIGGHALGTSR